MKRCPECGYRVKAQELKRCPLCGSRMVSDGDGTAASIQTHIHEREEDCLLSNQTNQKAAECCQPVKHPTGWKLTEGKSWPKRSNRSGEKNSPVVIAVVLILYVLLRSCGA